MAARRRLMGLALLCAVLCGSLAAAPLRAQRLEPGAGPVVLTADTLRYDQATETAIAEGNVEISRGPRRLLAERVVYDQRADRVEAEGDVILVEPGAGDVFADRMVLTGDLREGVVESVRVLLEDDSRVAAARGVRTGGNRTEFERVVYSPCRICPEGDLPPLWRLKASRVVHDQDADRIVYRNARFELFGVPIAYTPYFSHPDPSVERKTGFLTPTVGSDSEFGFLIQTPYYLALAPNRDLTVSPTFFTEQNPLLTAEYRELRPSGAFDIGGSITYATGFRSDPAEDPAEKEIRGHLEGSGRFALGGLGEFGRGWYAGYDLEVASDDTFLERYDISNDSILESRIFAERFWGRNYAAISGYGFQGLRRGDVQGEIPIVLPLAEFSYISEPWRWGSHFEADGNLLALTRTEGLDTRRASLAGRWRRPWLGPIGDLYELTVGLRGDAYFFEGDPETRGGDGTGFEGRLFPTATLDWRWPLVREAWGTRQVIEPVVSASWTPSGLNDEDIPIEDSLDFEFDDTNLFLANRFVGLDLVEEGARISYGLRFGVYGPGGELASGLFGQSYRFDDEGAFPEGSGLDDEVSDYIGRLDLGPVPWFDATYRFRARKEDFRLLRNEARVAVGPPRVRLNLHYISLADEPEEDALDEEFRQREELTAGVFVGVLPSLSLSAFTRRDLGDGRTVANRFGFVYRNPCLVLVGGLERRFTRDRDAPPTTLVTLRLVLKNLGEVEADTSLFGFGS